MIDLEVAKKIADAPDARRVDLKDAINTLIGEVVRLREEQEKVLDGKRTMGWVVANLKHQHLKEAEAKAGTYRKALEEASKIIETQSRNGAPMPNWLSRVWQAVREPLMVDSIYSEKDTNSAESHNKEPKESILKCELCKDDPGWITQVTGAGGGRMACQTNRVRCPNGCKEN